MADRLGNLEEMVLLMVVLVKEEAYGVLVREAYMEQYKQEISLSAIHTVLRRLEEKGFLVSELGGASAERGGRRKRLYSVTAFGYKKLTEYQEERNRIWSLIPKLKF
ncbi:MAG: helix-turn-helix transcriptional regulator [Saprospiraceae bacterium]|nr:helix-turn-helix transcriptional regulator [Saprospiraceae bacterium]